ncbi:hypothetical protein CFD26_100381 [Aspergillus turcosus]|uniref:Uncharacterized protein n=1 Tax=Aspergillus turcosus TaxID=1245748 RepID=A0A421CSL7_9EURO|nr:hypothetical protein CFD26_100381 [Aspergillus turcosus]
MSHESHDKKALELEFHWLQPVPRSSTMVLSNPPTPEESLDRRAEETCLFGATTDRRISSGHKIRMKTDDPRYGGRLARSLQAGFPFEHTTMGPSGETPFGQLPNGRRPATKSASGQLAYRYPPAGKPRSLEPLSGSAEPPSV